MREKYEKRLRNNERKEERAKERNGGKETKEARNKNNAFKGKGAALDSIPSTPTHLHRVLFSPRNACFPAFSTVCKHFPYYPSSLHTHIVVLITC